MQDYLNYFSIFFIPYAFSEALHLLQTSDSVTLDLLTFEDLELLRSRRVEGGSGCSNANAKTSNRRYLIVTYSVEFDR